MSNTPPKAGDGIEKIRKMKDNRGLLPFLPMERPAKPDLVILMAFGCFGALIGVPGVMNC